jgi:guanyl-specific ribonuclease Sa
MGGAGSYEVEKLEVKGLPDKIDGTKIRWFNNFSIRHKGGGYVKQKYKVTITGLSNRGKSRLVIYSDTHDPKLYYYDESKIQGDTFELDDGDPGSGQAP